jgi:hypothetical protein
MSIRVAVRCRPFNQREVEGSGESVVVMRGQTTELRQPTAYAGRARAVPLFEITSDYAFWSCRREDAHYASQDTVYTAIGPDMLTSVFDGYNTCLFAYGQTGSGKSFSMMGAGGRENRGIIPRLCEGLFEQIRTKTNEEWVGKVEVSYMEIYLEKIRDLLSSNRRRKPKVREHATTGPYVENLSWHAVSDYRMIAALMDEGNKVCAASFVCVSPAFLLITHFQSISFHIIFTAHLR